jgi:hypothetical protein
MKLKQLGANRSEVSLSDGTVVLFSYSTPVAAFVEGRGYLVTETNYSVTTSKHIRTWLPAGVIKIAKVPQAEIDALAGGR